MESNQNIEELAASSITASRDDPSEEKDDAESTDAEYVDSPEREEEYEGIPGDGNSRSAEFTSRNSPEGGTSAMEGELDFEDELREEKEEISKEILDDDSQKYALDLEKAAETLKEVAEEMKSAGEEEEEEEEDGQLSPENSSVKDGKEEGLIEEDDGELTDEDDLEEGEVKDTSPTSAKQQGKQVCRFFNRGQCTWGNLCRFLHVSVNDRGNYNMFAPAPKATPSFGMPGNGLGLPPGPLGPRGNVPEFHPLPSLPPLPPPPAPVSEPPPVESAWERGLRHAKELMKKALRRKEQEPDFEDKRLNLSIDENDRGGTDFEKDDSFAKPPFRRQSESFNSRYDEPDVFDNGEQEARDHWHGGRYENFEIRWTRPDVHKDRRGDNKDRIRNRFTPDREKPKQQQQQPPWKGKNWRDERLTEVQTNRPRADEWRDPWRRSKSPKGRRSRSRARSHGSYSSVSSRSYSGRSSRSSYSYSRSSSRSSPYSSRSRTPTTKSNLKRKPVPKKEVPPVNAKVLSPYKRKPIALRRTKSRSPTHSRSSHSGSHSRSSSSRSISASRSASRSRSRSGSYSRSLTMDSVSSASSSLSRSSSRSGSARNRNANAPAPKWPEEVKPPPPKPVAKPAVGTKPTSLLAEIQRLRSYDKMRETQKATPVQKKAVTTTAAAPPGTPQQQQPQQQQQQKPEARVQQQPVTAPRAMSPHSQIIAENMMKEPQKQSLPKQQIKLTLLNKALPSKIPNPLKRETELMKVKLPEKVEEKPPGKVGTKRAASPGATKSAMGPKRSTRRDELLKQLKAVEDAIARKRAKFS